MYIWPKLGSATERTMGRGMSRVFQGTVAKILKSSFSLWLLWCLAIEENINGKAFFMLWHSEELAVSMEE